MHEFLYLLALSAAARIYSSAAPTDHYLNEIKSFWRLPNQRCFEFSPYVRESWFQAKSYDAILKQYPGGRTIELNDEEFKVECAKKLGSAALKIHNDIQNQKKKWLQYVTTETKKTTSIHRRNIVEFTRDYIKDVPTNTKTQITILMDKQLKAFDETVHGMVSAATKKWKSVHDNVYSRLLSFHGKIVKTAVEAFKLRQKRIADFVKAIDARAKNFSTKYQRRLVENGSKNISSYGQLQFKIFGLNSTTDSSTVIGKSIRSVQHNYQVLYWNEVRNKVVRYRNRLQKYKDKLIKYYRSSYQIIVCVGKLEFDRKKYTGYCKELGEWWKPEVKNGETRMKYTNYKISWKQPEYNNLISGDASTVNDPVSEFKKQMLSQGDAAIKKALEVFTSWKKKWQKIHSDLSKQYFKIVRERHQLLLDGFKAGLASKYGFWCARFQAKYNAYKRNMIRRRIDAMRKYTNALKARLANGCIRFRENLKKYESTVKSYVVNAIDSYSDCMATREDNIEEYEKLMITKRDNERKKLQDKLMQMGSKKCDHYKEFLSSYHGERPTWDKSVTTVWSIYKGQVDEEMKIILEQFNKFWTAMLPKLVNHYECTYKCKTKTDLNFPEYTFDINWKITKPTIDSYPFQIKYFKKYRGYKLRGSRGRYRWS